MPTPRRYANPAERQAAYRQRREAARRQALAAKGMPPLPAIPTMPGTRRWAAMSEAARRLLQSVQEEMQHYYDERAEEWQASDRGETMAERLPALEEAIAAIEGVLA